MISVLWLHHVQWYSTLNLQGSPRQYCIRIGYPDLKIYGKFEVKRTFLDCRLRFTALGWFDSYLHDTRHGDYSPTLETSTPSKKPGAYKESTETNTERNPSYPWTFQQLLAIRMTSLKNYAASTLPL